MTESIKDTVRRFYAWRVPENPRTWRDVADDAGIPYQTVRCIVTGQRTIPRGMLGPFARALRADIRDVALMDACLRHSVNVLAERHAIE